MRYKDVLKRHMRKCDINPTLATDRPQWKGIVNTEVSEFETKRRDEVNLRRNELKARVPEAIYYNYVGGMLTCSECGRTFSAKIGYFTYIRAHQRSYC